MRSKNIKCIVARGLGEGAYFMSMQHYRQDIKKGLGFDAYPGTLNLIVKEKNKDLFKDKNPIRISGYKSNNKVFGGASCYRAKISHINGSIIVPDLTKHSKNLIEFIAPVHVKSELNIKDGDTIEIELL